MEWEGKRVSLISFYLKKKRSRLLYQRYVMQSITYYALQASVQRAIWALLLHQCIFSTCTCRCSCNCMWCVSNEKEPIEARIKRIEIFIIYALFSVVAILFSILTYIWHFQLLCIYLYHINKCDKMHSTIFTRSHIQTESHMGTHAQILIIMQY